MVIILANDFDPTTDLVIAWLKFFGKKTLRITDVSGWPNFIFNLTPEKEFEVRQNGAVEKNDGVWFRKKPRFSYSETVEEFISSDEKIKDYLNSEITELFNVFNLKNIPVLGKPDFAVISKVNALEAATSVGFKVPQTLITNQKEGIKLFAKNFEKIIIKSLTNPPAFSKDGGLFNLYTELFSEEDVALLPEKIFPSLVQEYINKEVELRVVYVCGQLFCGAVFTQQSRQTSVDSRKYSKSKPNRIVPFRLPKIIQSRIEALMKLLKLNTGVIDIIYSQKGEYIFLEVNPSGQFGNISALCNYNIEKYIAQQFVKN